jgi:2-haloacid dehalogenase
VRAAEHGMKTAYIARPYEHGTKQARDFKAEHDFTYLASSFGDLATQLGT